MKDKISRPSNAPKTLVEQEKRVTRTFALIDERMCKVSQKALSRAWRCAFAVMVLCWEGHAYDAE